MIERLNELWRTGRLVAEHPVASLEPERNALVDWIRKAEAEYRPQLPIAPPPLDVASAIWSVQQFYRASQLMVHRELGEEFIQSGLETEPFEERTPSCHSATDAIATDAIASIHYSVDLLLRFLPDLQRLAKAASSSDPLLAQMDAWAARWPLSAARMQNQTVCQEKLEPILLNRCLRIMYIERVLDRGPFCQMEMDRWNKINAQYEWKTFDTHR